MECHGHKIMKRMTFVLLIAVSVYAGNIDPYQEDSKYAYGENVGWLNFDPSQGPGVIVGDGKVIGYLWQENIGWINLSPTHYGGVAYDSQWRLSGYAWSENQGWINFNPTVPGDHTRYGVVIDGQGNFNGWAYGENIGWIRFDAAQSWNVRMCIVKLDDLTNFASYWLQSGDSPANLDAVGTVEMTDYAIFASWWQDFCPDGWRLK
jgi:hypothetical protein